MYEDRPSTPALRDRGDSENETPEPAKPEIHALGAPADKPAEPTPASDENLRLAAQCGVTDVVHRYPGEDIATLSTPTWRAGRSAGPSWGSCR